MNKNEDLKITNTTPVAVKLPEALPRVQKLHTNVRAGREVSSIAEA